MGVRPDHQGLPMTMTAGQFVRLRLLQGRPPSFLSYVVGRRFNVDFAHPWMLSWRIQSPPLPPIQIRENSAAYRAERHR